MVFATHGVVQAFVLAAAPLTVLGAGPSLMRRDKPSSKTVAPLQSALQHLLQDEAAFRMMTVEASVRPSFEAFPKNSQGHIPSEEIFPSIVRNYFAKEHGWLVKGLEPPGMTQTPTDVENALILREQAPGVAAELERIRTSDRGLSLSDLVGVITALEHLMIEESIQVLHDAYNLNGLKSENSIEEGDLRKVLESYLLLFRRGRHYNRTDTQLHARIRERAMRTSDWPLYDRFVRDTLHAGQLEEKKSSFKEVARILRGMAYNYGKWQNEECKAMKRTLIEMAPDKASGSVPFHIFRSEPRHANFQFTETAEYLKKIGVLDETVGTADHGSVRIANYLQGPTNCIAPSVYYAVCCLSECEAIISEVEAKAQSSSLGVELVRQAVGSTSSSTVQAPRILPPRLVSGLSDIATRHEELVPLHSADFKTWLYSAFPNECPLPTEREMVAEDREEQEAQRWLGMQHVCTRVPEWHDPADDGALFEL